jgi:hypothetical protein
MRMAPPLLMLLLFNMPWNKEEPVASLQNQNFHIVILVP